MDLRVATTKSLIFILASLSLSLSLSLSPTLFVEGMWCVARSDASDDALQDAIDYACAAGADCAPIQESGLCYLPNTLQAHSSYAFNSFYQRSKMVPGSCDFSGTATLAKTDPSYGSCVYPSSPSTAGGITPTTGTTPVTNSPFGFGGGTTSTGNPTNATPTTTTTIDGGGTGGLNPNSVGMGPPIPTTTDSNANSLQSSPDKTLLLKVSLFVVLPLAVF